jgi:RNA polymerase sigma-70 factor (ECF subfamily)
MAAICPARDTAAVLVAGRPAHRPGLSERFDAVYEAQVDFVWRTVRRLGVPDAAADDVVQSVFLVIFRRLDDFEQRASLKTWIYEIVLRVVRDYRRTMRRKSPHAGDPHPVDPGTLSAPVDQRPDALAGRAEAARMVQELLDELDDSKREVFILAEFEQLTLNEIGQILREPAGTIATRLRAARADFERAAKRRRAQDERRLRWTG